MKCCFLLLESFRVVLNVQLQCVINQASSQTPRPNCSCSYRSSTYIIHMHIYIHINIHALPVIHNHIAYVFVHVLNIKKNLSITSSRPRFASSWGNPPSGHWMSIPNCCTTCAFLRWLSLFLLVKISSLGWDPVFLSSHPNVFGGTIFFFVKS